MTRFSFVCLSLFTLGCSTYRTGVGEVKAFIGGFLPPPVEYRVSLSPVVYDGGLATLSPSDTLTAAIGIEGVRISVRHMNDKNLNDMLPEDSYRKHHTNPYTNGIKKDPRLRYVPPNIDSEFRVVVHVPVSFIVMGFAAHTHTLHGWR